MFFGRRQAFPRVDEAVEAHVGHAGQQPVGVEGREDDQVKLLFRPVEEGTGVILDDAAALSDS